uniref:Uncharacterized protein n=1 Tax=Peronospora matthiolae TaxID=2874970 RepID=A0AAV1V6H8_9STRA
MRFDISNAVAWVDARTETTTRWTQAPRCGTRDPGHACELKGKEHRQTLGGGRFKTPDVGWITPNDAHGAPIWLFTGSQSS